MPTFRIHNPRNRSDRVLIRLTKSSQSAFVPPPPCSTSGLPNTPSPNTPSPSGTSVSVKSKKKVSIQQIQEILTLLQKTKNKDLISLLSSSIAGLVDEDIDIDDTSEPEEVHVEEVKEDEVEEDEDVLVIEV